MLRVYQWREPIDYAVAYGIQKIVWSRTLSGEGPDALLVLTHPPTFTVGKSGRTENLLLGSQELERRGLTLFFSDRGGDVTYHGPGQLVVYPIIDLRRRGKDVHAYINDLEEVIIRTLGDYSVAAHRDDEHVGVWVSGGTSSTETIAAIGVRVSRWVTMHGLALNINPVMEHFSFINPCGIVDRGVTSLTKLVGREVSLDEVTERMVSHFGDILGSQIEWASGTDAEMETPISVGAPGGMGTA